MRSAGEMDQADAELRATICKVEYLMKLKIINILKMIIIAVGLAL